MKIESIISDRYSFILFAENGDFGDWYRISTSDYYYDMQGIYTGANGGVEILKRFPEYSQYHLFSIGRIDALNHESIGIQRLKPIATDDDIQSFLATIGWPES